MASRKGIPVFNLATKDGQSRFEAFLAGEKVSAGGTAMLSVSDEGLIKAVTFKHKGIVAINREVYDTLNDKQRHALALHEIGVHYGLERMIGKAAFNELLDKMDALRGRSANVDAAFASVPADTKSENVREEALAYLVENYANMPFVKRLMQMIKAWSNVRCRRDGRHTRRSRRECRGRPARRER
jgi:hypothetical protein